MIRISRHKTTFYEADCANCGCDFSYELDDLRTNYLRGAKVVSCPGCGEQVVHRPQVIR